MSAPKAAFGPLRTFVAWSALALVLALALALARVAAGAARWGLNLERSGAERADFPVVPARGSGRGVGVRSCIATLQNKT
jgi:hypothetical protein